MKNKIKNGIFTALTALGILLIMCLASHSAYAGQVSVSNVTGSLVVGDVGTETIEYDWEFGFKVGTAATGDFVTVTTKNIPLLAPKDVSIAGGTVVGRIELINESTEYPNSLNHYRTYKITFTRDLSNVSVSLTGHTVENHSSFIYEGGHWETSYIQVNGTTATTQDILHPSGDWFHGQLTGASPVTWHSAIYADGTIDPYNMAYYVARGTDIELYPGDRVIYTFDHSWLHLGLEPGYSVGGTYDGYYNHGTMDVPRSFTLVGPYGFYEPAGTLYQYKILWVSEYEFAMELTRIGDLGLSLMPGCIAATISPLNSSSIDYANNKTQEVGYTAKIVRNGSTIWSENGTYHEDIQSQEVLSDASFYWHIDTSVSNGSITPRITPINAGESRTVYYQPSSGYLLQSVRVDGSAVNISSYPDAFSFSNIQSNHTVDVVYARPTAQKTWVKN